MSNQNNKALSIASLLATALAAESGETVESVSNRVSAHSDTKATTLKNIIDAAGSAKSASSIKTKQTKVINQPTEVSNPRQRRNFDLPTRNIHVFTSLSLNSKFVATNMLFDGKTSEKAVVLLVRDKKSPSSFMSATDITHETVEFDIPFGVELDQLKADVYDKLVAQGFTMIGNRPRVSAPKTEVISVEISTEETNS